MTPFGGLTKSRGTVATFSCSDLVFNSGAGGHAQTTIRNRNRNTNCFDVAGHGAACGPYDDPRFSGQGRSDRGKGRARPRAWLGPRARLSSVWLEPRPEGRLARAWLPARSLEEGLVLKPDGQQLPSGATKLPSGATIRPVPRCP